MQVTRIRTAALTDAERLLEIYTYYVENTAITFDWASPTPAEFRQRMERTLSRYPYLVAETDGVVRGYACAGPFKGRAAYDWACETTVYLDPAARRQGLGRMLYQALEAACREMGVRNLYACIGYPEPEDAYLDRSSPAFHARMGFETVGRFHRCGYKFGRWYDMIWMEKLIAPHGPDCPPLRPFADAV